MISRTTARFRRAFAALPPDVQQRARQAYAAFRTDPRHPGLRLKRVHTSRPIYSARVGLGHRALGVLEGETMVWFWIGTHGDFPVAVIEAKASYKSAADGLQQAKEYGEMLSTTTSARESGTTSRSRSTGSSKPY